MIGDTGNFFAGVYAVSHYSLTDNFIAGPEISVRKCVRKRLFARSLPHSLLASRALGTRKKERKEERARDDCGEHGRIKKEERRKETTKEREKRERIVQTM